MKKTPYIDYTLVKSFKKSSYMKIWSRGSTIYPHFINVDCEIHNGKSFVKLKPKAQHVGHKFGEFSITKKRAFFKKKQKN